jgi:RND family efflux transporter MFP subunit
MQYQRLAIVSALAAALMLNGCGGQSARGPQPLNVDATTAQRRDIATFITLDGQISPLEESTLSFQQSGPVSAVPVNIGDRVSAGQLLARIDPSNIQAQLAQADAAASASAASAQGAVVGLPIAKQSNASTLATAKAALDNAKLNYDQNRQLFSQGYVSQQQLEGSRSLYVQAQSTYSSAVAGQQNNEVSTQNVKASLAQAQASAAQANVFRTQLSQTALYAPFDGVVTARLMDPGAMAGPGSPVLKVSRVDTVWVNINVPDEDLTYVRASSTITFTTSSLPGKSFTGRIDTVNAVPTQGTLSYLARLRQNNPGSLLRGGMLVTATIPKQRHLNAIVVPRSAVASNDKGTAVFIVQDGKAVSVPVQVGLQTDTLSEVISPKVTAGTQVITTRPDALQDGSAVAVNGAAPPKTRGGK